MKKKKEMGKGEGSDASFIFLSLFFFFFLLAENEVVEEHGVSGTSVGRRGPFGWDDRRRALDEVQQATPASSSPPLLNWEGELSLLVLFPCPRFFFFQFSSLLYSSSSLFFFFKLRVSQFAQIGRAHV